MTPAGTRLLDPKNCAIPFGLLQNSSVEKPSATVGTMKGMSARLSRIVAQLPRLLTMSQARGTPARRSRLETVRPIMNDQDTALSILVKTAALNARLGNENNWAIMPATAGIITIDRKNNSPIV